MRRKGLKFDIPQGSGCDCDLCDNDRCNKGNWFKAVEFCAWCGHGYVTTGNGGMCGRCGSRDFTRQKPDLPRYERPKATRWTIITHTPATVHETLIVDSDEPITKEQAIEVMRGSRVGSIRVDGCSVSNEQSRVVDQVMQ